MNKQEKINYINSYINNIEISKNIIQDVYNLSKEYLFIFINKRSKEYKIFVLSDYEIESQEKLFDFRKKYKKDNKNFIQLFFKKLQVFSITEFTNYL